jgi:hypothetical protein
LQQTPGFVQAREALSYESLSAQDRQSARDVAQQIRTCLLDNNANALEIWETHADILRALFARWTLIEEAIAAFEFDTALELMDPETA